MLLGPGWSHVLAGICTKKQFWRYLPHHLPINIENAQILSAAQCLFSSTLYAART